MNENDDSQKRPLNRLDDSNMSFPDCKCSEDHKNKMCPKPLSTQVTDPSQTMDVDIEKDDPGKRLCYRCGDCYLSFTDSQNLEDHKKKDCPKKPIVAKSQGATYQSCMDALKCAMDYKRTSFDLFIQAKSEAENAVMRHTIAKKRKVICHNAYKEAVEREKASSTTSTTEEASVSDILSRSFHELKAALEEEGVAAIAVGLALHKMKNANDVATFAATKEQYAISEVFKVLREQPSPAPSSLEVNQELKNIQNILEQSLIVLNELKKGVPELESSVLAMFEAGSKNEDPGLVGNSDLSIDVENESGGGSTLDTLQDKSDVDSAKFYQMDFDASRPSTSGTH